MKTFIQICAAAACFLLAVAAQTQRPAPEQPVPFSHKHHVGTLKLKCNMCHPNHDPGESMGVAPASTCMQCHSSVKTDSPHIAKIAAAAKENKSLKWARVYAIPDYVLFSHRTHLTAGNTCNDCHGNVAERAALFREGDISMTGCIACHKAKNASTDCQFCHEQR